MDKEVTRNMSRSRLRAHSLKVESYKWLGGPNVCDKCECADTQTRNMLSSIAIALRRVSCAENTRTCSLTFSSRCKTVARMFQQQPISQSLGL
eukprot:1073809-Pelagomonas_calceolata.AAC.1